MVLVPLDKLKNEYKRILLARNMQDDLADRLAGAFVEMANEGTYSHGINRFPVFIGQVDAGQIQLNNVPKCTNAIGALEQWDCQFGPGVLNGLICSDRAMELAKKHGIGFVAMKNSNHWMRGGAYAIRMAREGFAAIASTNSIAVMPAWGGKDHRLGTNPLIMAVPGNPPVLVDCSMSQYSYGQLEIAHLNDRELPVVGGYDNDGKLTKDPMCYGKINGYYPWAFGRARACR